MTLVIFPNFTINLNHFLINLVQQQYRRMAGGGYIGFNNPVFLSERDASNRTFAQGHYLKESKVFPKEAKMKDTLDLFFQLLATEVNVESAAVIAATLANGGYCPLTNDKVLRGEAVCNTLSLMLSCGMCDYSGQFAFNVGLPAKSGISGVILLVVPNVMGICVWSPPVDNIGNSVRGLRFCVELVDKFNLHNYDSLCKGSSMKKYDPRRTMVSDQAYMIVQLLAESANGDVSALRRFRAKYGAEMMNQADYDGRTALHLAAAEGHRDVVRFLLKECHVLPTPVDRFGGKPIDDAANVGRQDIVEMLEKYTKGESCPMTPAAPTTEKPEFAYIA